MEISDIETSGIILSKKRTIKVLAQADLRLCCSHSAKTGFLMTRLIGFVASVCNINMQCDLYMRINAPGENVLV